MSDKDEMVFSIRLFFRNNEQTHSVFLTALCKQKVLFYFKFYYRVSHSKAGKVILLWWGHRFWFFPIFWVLHVHEIDSFLPNSSVFIFLMLRALYGLISENLLFLNEFWLFLTISSLLWVIKSNKPSKTFIFTLN